jgi:hypothetical protein
MLAILASAAWAHGGDFAHRHDGEVSVARAFAAAAAEEGVPEDLLLALAFTASHFDPAARSAWGGYGLFDFREGQRDPSIEHAGALLASNPDRVIVDWRLQVTAGARMLAEHGRASHGGALPAAADLEAWAPAVRAFSGREEEDLQALYTRTIYGVVRTGFSIESKLGSISLQPRPVEDVERFGPAAPPGAVDYAGAASYPACEDNYSDYSRGGGDIDLIIIHTVQGSYAGCASWFANCSAQVSAHYIVQSSTGNVTQSVREADVGWHAGNWDYNERSVGIEHEGYVDDCGWYTDAMYAGSAALSIDIASRQGVPLDRSHVMGHNEVPDPYNPGQYGGSGHHTDPGDCWDWDYYMDLLAGGSGRSTGTLMGVVADGDIYNGTRLVGATAWIEETGESTVVDGEGYYRFEDLPFGSYTVHAVADGYAEGTCSKTTSGETDWCSIALSPGGGGVDTGDGATEDTAVADGGDSKPDAFSPSGGGAARPGKPVAMDEVGGCATSGRRGSWGWVVGVVGVLAARKRA